MFFKSKKTQAEKLSDLQAKELADAILNTLKTGLFSTKYHKAVGRFTLPPNIFTDIYICGFIRNFTNLHVNYIYNKEKKWTNNDVAKFFVNVFKNLNFTIKEMQFQTKIVNNEIKKKMNSDEIYMQGKEHARLCFCCIFGIFSPKENSALMPEAKKIAQNMPNILGDEKYEVKLATAMCELTIYDYLQRQFGGMLVGKNGLNNYSEQVELKNTDKPVNGDKLNISQRIEDKKNEIIKRQKEQKQYEDKKMNILNNIKNLYKAEWLYRTFLVTQVLGFVIICIMDITERNWHFLQISSYNYDWNFALLYDYYWSRFPLQNYITLVAIFFPFPVTKAIDWILSAKK